MGPLLLASLVGGGALLFFHEKSAAQARASEPGAAGSLPAGAAPVVASTLTAKEVHAAVQIALASETSPANLSAFSSVLGKAGYPHSSHELAVKASNLL